MLVALIAEAIYRTTPDVLFPSLLWGATTCAMLVGFFLRGERAALSALAPVGAIGLVMMAAAVVVSFFLDVSTSRGQEPLRFALQMFLAIAAGPAIPALAYGMTIELGLWFSSARRTFPVAALCLLFAFCASAFVPAGLYGQAFAKNDGPSLMTPLQWLNALGAAAPAAPRSPLRAPSSGRVLSVAMPGSRIDPEHHRGDRQRLRDELSQCRSLRRAARRRDARLRGLSGGAFQPCSGTHSARGLHLCRGEIARLAASQEEAHTTADGDAKVFVCHATEDTATAERVCAALHANGVATWLARRDLLPGQKWELEIRKALRGSRCCLAFLSSHSARRGYVHTELRMALNVLSQIPDGDVFIIPIRIDECELPDARLSELHRVDLEPSFEDAIDRALVGPIQQAGHARALVGDPGPIEQPAEPPGAAPARTAAPAPPRGGPEIPDGGSNPLDSDLARCKLLPDGKLMPFVDAAIAAAAGALGSRTIDPQYLEGYARHGAGECRALSALRLSHEARTARRALTAESRPATRHQRSHPEGVREKHGRRTPQAVPRRRLDRLVARAHRQTLPFGRNRRSRGHQQSGARREGQGAERRRRGSGRQGSPCRDRTLAGGGTDRPGDRRATARRSRAANPGTAAEVLGMLGAVFPAPLSASAAATIQMLSSLLRR